MSETPRATTAFPAPRIKGSSGPTAPKPTTTKTDAATTQGAPKPHTQPKATTPNGSSPAPTQAPRPAPTKAPAQQPPAPSSTQTQRPPAPQPRPEPAAPQQQQQQTPPARPTTPQPPAPAPPASASPGGNLTPPQARPTAISQRAQERDRHPRPETQQAPQPRPERRPAAPARPQAPRQYQDRPQDPREHQPAPRGHGYGYEDDLFDTTTTTIQPSIRPKEGVRSALYDITGGRLNLGRSKAELYRDSLIEDVQREIPGATRHVMMWSQKGGVGKTTTSVQLGITLASLRTDKILGLDVNPDGGSMALRVPMTTRKNILDLRNALSAGRLSPTDFDSFVNHAAHRFDTVVMPPGDKPSYPLTGEDYTMIADDLRLYYPYKIVLTDCGTNLSDVVMGGVRARADQLVAVTTTVKDEAQVTARGLAAMVRDGQGSLVRNAITVLVEKAPRGSNVDTRKRIEGTADEIRDYFGRHTKQVISVPYDPIVQAGEILDPNTRSAAQELAQLELAAAVVESLATMPPRGAQRPRS